MRDTVPISLDFADCVPELNHFKHSAFLLVSMIPMCFEEFLQRLPTVHEAVDHLAYMSESIIYKHFGVIPRSNFFLHFLAECKPGQDTPR